MVAVPFEVQIKKFLRYSPRLRGIAMAKSVVEEVEIPFRTEQRIDRVHGLNECSAPLVVGGIAGQ